MPGAAGACLAIAAEGALKLFEQVRFRAEMAEVIVALRLGRGHGLFHLLAVVAVIGVAFDGDRLDAFAPEDLLEGVLDRRGAGAG